MKSLFRVRSSLILPLSLLLPGPIALLPLTPLDLWPSMLSLSCRSHPISSPVSLLSYISLLDLSFARILLAVLSTSSLVLLTLSPLCSPNQDQVSVPHSLLCPCRKLWRGKGLRWQIANPSGLGDLPRLPMFDDPCCLF